MDFFSSGVAVLAGIFVIYMLYRSIKNNPDSLTWKSINKSMITLGFLALALIAFIGIVVWLLRQGA